MFRAKYVNVTISFPRNALEAIFDECDRFDVDETGGRIVGTYERQRKQYTITVLGVIGPGPNAQRSPVSFFQDGEYQERIFREAERDHPDLEHLGNWHTHHVNGLATLSSGDKTTYQRIVNHSNHNTDFFYALLVVRKTPQGDQRYDVKHYFVFRNDQTIYEIPDAQINIVDETTHLIDNARKRIDSASSSPSGETEKNGKLQRARDQEFFSEFYPRLKPGFSKSLGVLFWKGSVDLVDGSQANVLAMEETEGDAPSYSITIPGKNPPDVVREYKHRVFKSARHAVLQLERDMNRELFLRLKEQ
jgi:hypothetical protein